MQYKLGILFPNEETRESFIEWMSEMGEQYFDEFLELTEQSELDMPTYQTCNDGSRVIIYKLRHPDGFE